jgi:hypothetical protein
VSTQGTGGSPSALESALAAISAEVAAEAAERLDCAKASKWRRPPRVDASATGRGYVGAACPPSGARDQHRFAQSDAVQWEARRPGRPCALTTHRFASLSSEPVRREKRGLRDMKSDPRGRVEIIGGRHHPSVDSGPT